MAFNPFHKFRKHQKAFLAGLGIFCMFSFVLCSGLQGGGDAMSALISLFGGRSTSGGAPVATLYGKDVGQRHLDELAQQRAIAQVFLTQAMDRAMQNRGAEVRKKMKEGHAGINLPPQQEDMFLRQELQKDEEMGRLQSEYFGLMFRTSRATSYPALLDFMIWQREAERLGISLTKQDINALIGRMTNNRLSPKDSGAIELAMKRDPKFKTMTTDKLIKALGAEFQVQLAQLALIGSEPQFGPQVSQLAEAPAVPTPQQFWNYYRDQSVGLEFALLPFKVEDFLAQVKEKPTEAELKALYEKYKDKEADPQSSEPGFKRPRRIQVEWVSGKADSPFYRKAGLESFQTTQALSMVGNVLGNAASRLAVGIAADLVTPRGFDTRQLVDYEKMKRLDYHNNLTWLEPWAHTYDRFHPEYLFQPAGIASAVGAGLVGPLPVTVSGARVVTALLGPAEQRENAVRLRYGTSLLLTSAALSPLTTTALAASASTVDEYVPYAFVKRELADKHENKLARDALLGNLHVVQEQIEKLSKDKGKEAELQKYLAEAVKKYDLQTGKSTALRDQNKDKLSDDPGMKAFKEAYLKPPSFDATGKDFDKMFFTEKKPFEAEQWPNVWESATAEKQFLFWKTEDHKAERVPFEQVRADVEKAWRYQKARELAKKQAEEVAKEAKKTGGDLRKLTDLATQNKSKVIEIGPIAQQKRKRSASATVEYSYEGPTMDKSKVPNLDGDAPSDPANPNAPNSYGQKFASQLLPLRDKDKGTTVVLQDQTEGTYYLAVLAKQVEPDLKEFYEVYQNSATAATTDASTAPKKSDRLFEAFLRQQQGQYREELLERLRKDAKLEIKKEALGRMNQGGDEG